MRKLHGITKMFALLELQELCKKVLASWIEVRKCSYLYSPDTWSIYLQNFELQYELYGLEYEQRSKSHTSSPVSLGIQLFFLQCMPNFKKAGVVSTTIKIPFLFVT